MSPHLTLLVATPVKEIGPPIVDLHKPGREGQDCPDPHLAGVPATNWIAGTAALDGSFSLSGT